jgi:hypothetical protein
MENREPRTTERRATQLQLLTINDRLVSLDAKDRALVVRLLARLLREAAQGTAKVVADDDA